MVISNGIYSIMTVALKCPRAKEILFESDGWNLILRLLETEVNQLDREYLNRPTDTTHVVDKLPVTSCLYLVGCIAKIAARDPSSAQAIFEAGGVDVLVK